MEKDVNAKKRLHMGISSEKIRTGYENMFDLLK
jgi:hypothetical protein